MEFIFDWTVPKLEILHYLLIRSGAKICSPLETLVEWKINKQFFLKNLFFYLYFTFYTLHYITSLRVLVIRRVDMNTFFYKNRNLKFCYISTVTVTKLVIQVTKLDSCTFVREMFVKIIFPKISKNTHCWASVKLTDACKKRVVVGM